MRPVLLLSWITMSVFVCALLSAEPPSEIQIDKLTNSEKIDLSLRLLKAIKFEVPKATGEDCLCDPCAQERAAVEDYAAIAAAASIVLQEAYADYQSAQELLQDCLNGYQ